MNGMEIIGEKHEKNQYFLVELITSGEVMKERIKVLEPHLKGSEALNLNSNVYNENYN